MTSNKGKDVRKSKNICYRNMINTINAAPINAPTASPPAGS